MRRTLDHLKTSCCYITILCAAWIANVIPLSSQTDDQDISSISTTTIDHIQFISLHDFTDAFNARTYYSEKTKKMIVYLEDKVIKVTAFNPFIIVDEVTYQLTVDTFIKENEIYVPMNDFLSIIRRLFPEHISAVEKDGQLYIQPLRRLNIHRIDFEEKINGMLIKIGVSRKFSHTDIGFRERHGWLYVDIYGGLLDSTNLRRQFNSGLVQKILPLQLSDQMAQISFKLRKPIIDKQVFFDNPDEIMISLKTKADIPADLDMKLEREKQKWLIDKIVIDPGHGGKDPGAPSPYGSYEKNITLAIALELRNLIEKNTDIKVVMTRESDKFVELKHRTDLANRNQAKLFISIHANSNNSRRVDGVSTYFLGPENTEEAREVALLENSVIKYEKESQYANLTQENIILAAMAQNVFVTESQDFAAIVQDEMSQHCDLKDRGVKQAGFYVLWTASMPNILIETAFLSNKEDEKKLRSRSFQKKIAEAIFKSIMKFKQKTERDI